MTRVRFFSLETLHVVFRILIRIHNSTRERVSLWSVDFWLLSYKVVQVSSITVTDVVEPDDG